MGPRIYLEKEQHVLIAAGFQCMIFYLAPLRVLFVGGNTLGSEEAELEDARPLHQQAFMDGCHIDAKVRDEVSCFQKYPTYSKGKTQNRLNTKGAELEQARPRTSGKVLKGDK